VRTTTIRNRENLGGVKSNGKVVSLRQAGDGVDPNKSDTSKLARLIAAYAYLTGNRTLTPVVLLVRLAALFTPAPSPRAVRACASVACTGV
jgi:hypothetical protein